MPCSRAFLAASSDACCAANGVPLSEPLKPFIPALDQETTLPLGSVIVMMVLLKVDWICTTPLSIFFLTFFFVRARLTFAMISPLLINDYFFFAPPFFFTAERFGPLRIRALVEVRWPRTGSDFRCRRPR